jgi:hypothetical protein
VETEPAGELLDPATGLIGGDKLGNLRGVETGLSLLRWVLTVVRSHRLRQSHQGPEVFYLVREV